MKNDSNAPRETITVEQVRKDLQKIVGLPVARAWKGHGTAIFLELGELRKDYHGWKNASGENYSMQGDWTLGELWGWKIIHDKSVVFDATEFNKFGVSTKPVKEVIEHLVGKTIISVVLNEDATLLTIVFNTNLILQVSKG